MQSLGFSPAMRSLRFYSSRPQINLRFFSKPDCQLCNEANAVLKTAISQLQPKMQQSISPVEYVDITKPENGEWFECYRYDIPVLWIQREGYKNVVFMHRFDKEELVEELGQEM